MKLIDLLVQELPERGGWPDDVKVITQNDDGGLCLWKLPGVLVKNGYWRHPTGQGLHQFWPSLPHAEDKAISIVCKEYYEAKLHSVDEVICWDGEGIPPVGSECEFNDGLNPWTIGTIKYVSKHSIVIELKEPGPDGDIEPAFRPSILTFRPLRTDVERKREETIASMIDSLECSHYELDKGAAEIILDAIAQGKVSGIKLAD